MKRTITLISALLVFKGALCAAEPATAWLSDLDLTRVRQSLGRAHKDKSFGNKPLSIGGTVFARGIGMHSEASFELQVHPGAEKFIAAVGVDDAVGKNGCVEFEVYADSKQIWVSGPMRGGDPAKPVEVDLKGISRLLLVVSDGGDGAGYDHADWVDARVIGSGEAPLVSLAPPEQAVILTPKSSPQPRINGARVFGVRPGSPFLFTIPATGVRPMAFSAKGLPAGLTLDPNTGRITGSVGKAGTYPVTLEAKNAKGKASRDFRIVVGEAIALTPPMGWNSWNYLGCEATDAKVRAIGDAFVKLDLINHGWTYVNLDDGWQSRQEHAAGGPGRFPPGYALQADTGKFPDIKATSDYLHSLGLKMGLYSTPWKFSYGNYTGGSADDEKGHRDSQKVVGKVTFENQDAKQWAAWGIDYLKYDWSPIDVENTRRMSEALRKSGRDIVFSLSNGASLDKAQHWAELSNLWRTTGDISATWTSMSGIGFSQDPWKGFAGPGHWNDPDMMVLGHDTLSPNEQYTHMSLWCLLSAPLLLGFDVGQADAFVVSLLTNDEVLEVNQDPLGKAAGRVSRDGACEVWSKEMEDGSKAVGLFNRGLFPATVSAKWSDLCVSGPQKVRDLWRQQDLGDFKDQYQVTVPRHGCVLVRIWPRK
jgi:alpha-galactosidase